MPWYSDFKSFITQRKEARIPNSKNEAKFP